MSEGSMSLPPRHIRRYPTASTTSSSSSTAGPGSLEETGKEEVFLKYNESYHTITRHFHCHAFAARYRNDRKDEFLPLCACVDMYTRVALKCPCAGKCRNGIQFIRIELGLYVALTSILH